MNLDLFTLLEWTAVGLNLAYVILLAREIVWAWPAAILGAALSLIVLFDAKLYNDVWLYVLYVVMGGYGWYVWVYGGEGKAQPPVVHTQLKEGLLLLVLGTLGTLGLGYAFDRWTDADIPYWDAFTSSFSVVGTYLQARKHLENWLLWLVVDAVYVGVYWYKGLSAFAWLSLVYLGLATWGYVAWKRGMG